MACLLHCKYLRNNMQTAVSVEFRGRRKKLLGKCAISAAANAPNWVAFSGVGIGNCVEGTGNRDSCVGFSCRRHWRSGRAQWFFHRRPWQTRRMEWQKRRALWQKRCMHGQIGRGAAWAGVVGRSNFRWHLSRRSRKETLWPRNANARSAGGLLILMRRPLAPFAPNAAR